MDSLRLDVAHTVGQIRRSPLFASVVTVTLAVAVGAATAIFGVVYGVLLRPLPIHDQDRVVILRKEQISGSETLFPFAIQDMRTYAEQTRVLEAVGGVQYDGAWPSTVVDQDREFHVTMAVVSGDLFRVLDVRSIAGRVLNAQDDIVGERRSPSSALRCGADSSAGMPASSVAGYA